MGKRQADERAKNKPKLDGVATSRTFVNSSMREPLDISDFVPAREGAMDYAKIKSKGF